MTVDDTKHIPLSIALTPNCYLSVVHGTIPSGQLKSSSPLLAPTFRLASFCLSELLHEARVQIIGLYSQLTEV